MKHVLLLFVVLMHLTIANAQNNMQARIAYEEAEAAFAEENFSTALVHINKTESLLGQWTPKVGYLKIILLDKQIDYATPSADLQELNKQVSAYMKYAEKAGNTIDMDKFKHVYAIEQKLKAKLLEVEWKKMPEYVAGDEAYSDKEYTLAISHFKKAVDKGNGLAMYDLGLMYDNGRGVVTNHEEAARWYRMAADKGIANAMFALAISYATGEGVSENDEEAFKWFKKAAENGQVRATRYVGYYLAKGFGTKKNITEAMKWSLTAAEKGDVDAMHDIGELYSYNRAALPNRSEGYKWYKKAADKGHLKAIIRVFDIHGAPGNAEDWGTRSNCDEVMPLLLKAAEKGEMEEINKLADAYYLGLWSECAQKDLKKATHWFLQAAEKGDADSKEILKVFVGTFRYGIDVEKDKKFAKELEAKIENLK